MFNNLSPHLFVCMLINEEVGLDSAVGVAVVLFVDKTVLLPVEPGPPVNLAALRSAAGCQSPGQEGHGLWSDRQKMTLDFSYVSNMQV